MARYVLGKISDKAEFIYADEQVSETYKKDHAILEAKTWIKNEPEPVIIYKLVPVKVVKGRKK